MVYIEQQLPKGWKWSKLCDIATIVSGTTPQTAVDEYWDGDIVWITPTDLGQLTDTYISDSQRKITTEGFRSCNINMVPKDSIVMSSRAPIGHLGIAKVELCTNQGCKSFIPSNVVLMDFLFYALKVSVPRLQELGSGATFKEISKSQLANYKLPLPPLSEQERIVKILNYQLSVVAQARQSAQEQLEAAKSLSESLIRHSLSEGKTKQVSLGECLEEVKKGIGDTWAQYRLLGATRGGIAPAKEGVGKNPERYKLVDELTVFYNPMRILLGSIAFVDEGDEPGITSPDYVVIKGKQKLLHSRWFYYWFRSRYGMNLINSLSRGAVRERILFNRLSKGEIEIPDWETQLRTAKKLKGIESLQQTISNQMDTINLIPTSLLRKAFQGEL